MPSATVVQPEQILKELAGVWSSLAKAESEKGSSGVLRACAMTLIVAVEGDQDAITVGGTLAELMHEHPSRAIVLKLSDAAEDVLEARVFAQCWMPFGGRQQICCEQIEITASHSRLAEVPITILGLTVPDLPVVLWPRAARCYREPAFEQLLALADKIVIDSRDFPDATSALDYLGNLRQHSYLVADLSWTRLTRWREMVAQVFEAPGTLNRIGAASLIRIRHAGEQPSLTAYYLGAWLMRTLKTKLDFEPVPGKADGDVRGLILERADLQVEISAVDGSCFEVRIDSRTDRTVFPPISDYLLLREELAILARDPVYEQSLEIARGLLQNR